MAREYNTKDEDHRTPAEILKARRDELAKQRAEEKEREAARERAQNG